MQTALELLYEMETELLANVLRALAKGEIGSAHWAVEKLNELGIVNAANIRAVRGQIEKAVPFIRAEIEERAAKSAAAIDRAVSGLNLGEVLPFDADPQLVAVINAWQGNAQFAVEKMGATLLSGARDIYLDTVNKTTAQVVAGHVSGRQAIANTAREWAANGIPALVDAAGRTWSTEAYASTIIRSNARNAATNIQTTRCDEYGVDLVEVSSHTGARPGCAPYQGRIYSLSGKSDEFPTLSSTSYGDPAGLFGINCGHSLYPFILGASKQTYRPVPTRENEEEYDTSQEQRALERGIRQAKRELSVMQAIGEKDEVSRAKEKVANRQAAIREFIDKTGRTRHIDREQIYQ